MKKMIVNIEKEQSSPRPGVYSYLNFFSLLKLIKSGGEFDGIRYFCDGILMCLLVRFFTGENVKRLSFDFSSMAPGVLERCEKDGLKLFIFGSTEESNLKFSDLITKKYSEMNIVGRRNGYLSKDKWLECAENINQTDADVVIVGMGAPIQDEFGKALLSTGFKGEVYTCGGFIHQCDQAGDFNYYPSWVNKLEVRWLYRMIKEPNTVKRYMVDYPYALVVIIGSILFGRLKLNVIK